jgi:UDP-N-acetylmuramate: L-alanyl-gamma-D-glutamyl-meso-diaminopimelate ligase
MKIHLIAIGGSAMHNLAIALHLAGHHVQGSDDEIFDPAKSRLEEYHLLPSGLGWMPERITSDLDFIILGMHARKDNPELIRAQELGLKIYSYPEFIYEQSINKKRVVIGGSHGKTTTTSMIMHVLKNCNFTFDYLVGAMIEGFDVMVRLSDAPVIIIEGDEYLSSALDLKPKFLHYYPHVAVLTGIAWDHINVFPQFSSYVEQFDLFIQSIENGGVLYYYQNDAEIAELLKGKNFVFNAQPYSLAGIEHGIRFDSIVIDGKHYYFDFFGKHNLENMLAAWHVCKELGIHSSHFFQSMQSFKGASRRLQTYISDSLMTVLFDFAHSPSKVNASTRAVKQRYPDQHLLAVLELHTFSSLNISFIAEYKGALDFADEVIVFFDKHTLEHKRLSPLEENKILPLFKHPAIKVIQTPDMLEQELKSMDWRNFCVLFMSSGNFRGIDLKKIASEKYDAMTHES